jgi:hypothetical protein
LRLKTQKDVISLHLEETSKAILAAILLILRKMKKKNAKVLPVITKIHSKINKPVALGW